MDIPRYIAEHLLSNGKVFFPGLGTLKVIRKEAGINKGKFTPPSSDLYFTSEVVPDEENHFPSMFSQKEGCSLDDARQFILEYIDDIRFAFNKGEAFVIEGVCRFSIDEDNNIEVIKDPQLMLEPSDFGLESFEIEGFEGLKTPAEPKKMEAFNVKEPKKEKIELVLDIDHDMRKFEETYVSPAKKQTTDKSTTESSEKITTPKEAFPSYEEGSKPHKSRRTLLVSLVSAAVLIAAIVFFAQKAGFWDGGVNLDDIFGSSEEMEVNDDFSDVKDEDFDFDEMVGELEGKDETAGINADSVARGGGVNEDKSTSLAEGKYIEYHIIAGSFRDYQNARELQQQLTLVGYPSMVLDLGNGIYRVSAISYRDKVTALNELVKFREKTGMEGSWLMNLE